MAEAFPALRNLIDILRDGEDGFAELAAHVKDEDCRSFLQEESFLRATFAVELKRLTYQQTGADFYPTGTRLAAVHRSWLALKAQLGAGDATLLAATDTCENAASACYLAAQEAETTPPAVQALLHRQVDHLQRSHTMLRHLREKVSSDSSD